MLIIGTLTFLKNGMGFFFLVHFNGASSGPRRLFVPGSQSSSKETLLQSCIENDVNKVLIL